MKIYRNANWTRRNHDCTNVVFQVVEGAASPRRYSGTEAPAGEWIPAEVIPADMQELGGFSGHRFFGYL